MFEHYRHLKQRLLQPLPGKDAQFLLAPSFRSGMKEEGPRQKAGVIILLYTKNNSVYFPLIERPVYNGVHSGQISLPGGKAEDIDKNLPETALRECEEEIGVSKNKITVLGSLTELFIPVSKYEVYPIVGFTDENVTFKPQPEEVASILEVPLNSILKVNNIEYKKVLRNGYEETIPFFNINNKMVWGATAMILSEFIFLWNEVTDFHSETRFL